MSFAVSERGRATRIRPGPGGGINTDGTLTVGEGTASTTQDVAFKGGSGVSASLGTSARATSIVVRSQDRELGNASYEPRYAADTYPLEPPVARRIPENFWRGIAWSEELGLFVAVGNASALATSTDGVYWTARLVPGASSILYGVAWAQDIARFAGVGVNRTIYSDDGITWQSRSAPVNASYYNAVWSPELRLFAAIAEEGVAMTSFDGVTWRTHVLPTTSNNAIAWSSELGRFVVVGGSDGNLYSNDGITWRTGATSFGANPQFAVTWSPERRLFVSAGTNGRAQTSADGITWTQTTIGVANSTNTWRSVVWSKDMQLFVAVSSVVSDGRTQFATSTDGIVWTTRAGIRAAQHSSVTWAPKLQRIVAVASTGTVGYPRCMTMDAKARDTVHSERFETNWFTQTVAAPTSVWWGIAHSPALRTVVVSTNTTLARSQDAIHWTTISLASGQFRGGVWAPELGMFVFVSSATSTSARVVHSTNGTTWTTIAGNLTQGRWHNVAWSPELRRMITLTSETGTAASAAYSSNGTSWTTISATNTTERWLAVAWSPELRRFVALSMATSRVNPSAGAMYSSDGITWVTYNQAAITIGEWQSLAWSGSLRRFVAVSNASTVRCATSETGLPGSWTTRAVPSADWSSVHWNGELARFEAYNTNISTTGPAVIDSPDGINWTSRSSPEIGGVSRYWSAWVPWLNRTLAVGSSNNMAHRSSPLVARRSRALRRVNKVDEVPWVTRSTATNNSWFSCAWIPEVQRIMALTFDGARNRVMVSDNYGDTWSTRSSATNNGWWSVVWVPEAQRLVSIASSGVNSTRVMVSDNYGDTWQTRSSATNNQWYSVVWIPEASRLVAVSIDGSGTQVMVSDNYGDTWQTRSTPGNSWYALCWVSEASRVIATSSSGTGDRVMVSDDYGDTWSTRSSATDNEWFSLAWVPETSRLVAVAGGASDTASERVMVSDDYGETWSTRSSATNDQWFSVVWAAEMTRLVVIARNGGNNTRVMVSDDYGETWATRSNATNNSWRQVVWIPEVCRLLALSSNRVMIQSYASSTAPSSTAITVSNKPVMTINEGGILVPDGITSFTGAHKVEVRHPLPASMEGRIAACTGDMVSVSLEDSPPVVRLATSPLDPGVYGVFNIGGRSRGPGNALVNSVGEGAMWVCDMNGALSAGDYVASSTLAGYGARQQGDEARCAWNYSVAKMVGEVTFERVWPRVHRYYRWEDQEPEGEAGEDGQSVSISSRVEITQEDYETRLAAGEDVHREDVTPAPPLKLRFLALAAEPDVASGDNTIEISEEEYETRKAAGDSVYVAAFAPCVYVCG